MQRTERNFFIPIICSLFILINLTLVVYAQLPEPVSAVVVVERDFLRVQPSKTAKSETIVTKGTKLKVVPASVAKSWYLAYLEDVPSVGGYIHGNSIRIVKSRTTSTKTNQTSTRSNYCQPPLYCPDIDTVHVALFDNKDKFQKGKFEKTVDWEKRKSSILSSVKLKEGKTTSDKMYFLYEQGTLSRNLNEPDYNADEELWSFPLVFRESYDETCIPIFSQGSGQVLCLIVKKNLGTELKVLVSMKPSLAASNEKNLQIVFVGKIIEPYLWNNENSSIKDVLSDIYFELEEIICVNPKTGQQWKVDIPTKINNTTSKPNSTKTEVNSSDEEALEQFKKTLISEPMNAEAHLGIGKIYSKRGNYDLAISSLKTALFFNNQLIDAYIELGRIFFIKGDCPQAEYNLRKALELDNQNSFALGLKRLVEKCSSIDSSPSTNTSQLTIDASLSNLWLIILNKSLTAILAECELKPLVNTKLGKEYDLVATFYKSLNENSSGKYLAFRNEFYNLINKYIVKSVETNYSGKVSVNLPFGTYYIFTMAWYRTGGFFVKTTKYAWNKEVILNSENSTVSINFYNASFEFK